MKIVVNQIYNKNILPIIEKKCKHSYLLNIEILINIFVSLTHIREWAMKTFQTGYEIIFLKSEVSSFGQIWEEGGAYKFAVDLLNST